MKPPAIETKMSSQTLSGRRDVHFSEHRHSRYSPIKSPGIQEPSPISTGSPRMQELPRQSHKMPSLKIDNQNDSLSPVNSISPPDGLHPIPDLDSIVTNHRPAIAKQVNNPSRPLPQSPISSPGSLSPVTPVSSGSKRPLQRNVTSISARSPTDSPVLNSTESNFESWISDSLGILYSPKDKKKGINLHNQSKEDERAIKWSVMRKMESQREDSFHIMPSVRFAHDAKFEARVWKGIPSTWRLHAWLDMSVSFSGFYATLSKDQIRWLNSELFKKYRDLQVADSPFETLISNAVERTLPRLAVFQGVQGIFHKESLSRILTAISLYNCEIGFVPGINLWVGLLLTMFGEESTFFVAQRLFYDGPAVGSPSFYNIKRLYTKSDAFMTENVLIHDSLLQLWLPKLKARMDKFNICSISYLEIWYHSLFVACSNVSRFPVENESSYKGLLPWPVVLRIWDIFMFYGWDILSLVSIAILDFYFSEIMTMDPTTLSYFLGIEGDTDVPSALGIPVDSLPSITNPDKFIDLVHQLFFNGKRRLFSRSSSSNGRLSVDSNATLNETTSTLTRLSGRDLIKHLRDRFHQDV